MKKPKETEGYGGIQMYRKQDPNQQMLEGFVTPFGKLAAGNRWVKQAELTPWDYIEEAYAKNFSPNSGTPALSARMAYGAIYVSEKMKLTDRETVEYIAENPYIQYFLGLSEFRQGELFDASMMVHFRKRFPAEVINEIRSYVHRILYRLVGQISATRRRLFLACLLGKRRKRLLDWRKSATPIQYKIL